MVALEDSMYQSNFDDFGAQLDEWKASMHHPYDDMAAMCRAQRAPVRGKHKESSWMMWAPHQYNINMGVK